VVVVAVAAAVDATCVVGLVIGTVDTIAGVVVVVGCVVVATNKDVFHK